MSENVYRFPRRFMTPVDVGGVWLVLVSYRTAEPERWSAECGLAAAIGAMAECYNEHLQDGYGVYAVEVATGRLVSFDDVVDAASITKPTEQQPADPFYGVDPDEF